MAGVTLLAAYSTSGRSSSAASPSTSWRCIGCSPAASRAGGDGRLAPASRPHDHRHRICARRPRARRDRPLLLLGVDVRRRRVDRCVVVDARRFVQRQTRPARRHRPRTCALHVTRRTRPRLGVRDDRPARRHRDLSRSLAGPGTDDRAERRLPGRQPCGRSDNRRSATADDRAATGTRLTKFRGQIRHRCDRAVMAPVLSRRGGGRRRCRRSGGARPPWLRTRPSARRGSC